MTCEITTIAPRHPYEPLEPDSIRVIKILPTLSEDADICCQTACFRRDEGLDYTALSYTWGPETEPSHIRLDGRCFLVRKNLYSFLRAARKHQEQSVRWFWVDAISIDQSNNAERTHQVASMSKIYSDAKIVLIWLGPRSPDSDSAMRVLDEPVGYWRDSQRFYDMWTLEHSTAIHLLVERPYWSRLWVFQEVAFARRKLLMCGDWCVAWESFADLVDVVERKSTSDSGVRLLRPDTLAGAKRSWGVVARETMESCHAVRNSLAMLVIKRASQTVQVVPLWDLMFALQHLSCSDPRDKVYALLGVAAQTLSPLEPDYTMSVLDVAHAVLRYEHRIKPPGGINEVEQQCQELEGLLGLQNSAMLKITDQKGSVSVPKSVPMHQAFAPGVDPTNSDIHFRNGVNVWWAAFHGHDAVEDLLVRYTDTNMHTSHGYLDHWLWYSVKAGLEETVESLLALEAVRNNHHLLTKVRHTRSARRTSLLDIALCRGHVGITRMLLETGHLDVNAQLPSRHMRKLCPLQFAVQQRDAAMVEMLMSMPGIDVHQRYKGRTPLESAVKMAQAHTEAESRQDFVSKLRNLLSSKKGSQPAEVFASVYVY
ncbi:hypothetical protein LTR10_010633 [Elasticomyces elasticus]|nr:hypothetical protein LTR10_010633 [Elasticomyces elasticus]KAK4968239.1 hypothetical protein LTR42_009522 [Elasticomyces elasticus]